MDVIGSKIIVGHDKLVSVTDISTYTKLYESNFRTIDPSIR
jgi:hypothetical protein